MEPTTPRSAWVEYELVGGVKVRAVGRPGLVKLIAILRQVWSGIPEADRQLLRDHLNAECNAPSGLTVDVHDLKAAGRNQIASMEDEGHHLWFSDRVLAEMPEDAATWVLAHELAHSYQYASLRAAGRLSDGVPDCTATEEDANRRAAEWGFSEARKAKEEWWAMRESERLLQERASEHDLTTRPDTA